MTNERIVALEAKEDEMSIMGTCKKCGGETMDYCCTACMAKEIQDLEDKCELLTIALQQATGMAEERTLPGWPAINRWRAALGWYKWTR